jgi:type II restriction/modification system DNA methylase subunit YeeA
LAPDSGTALIDRIDEESHRHAYGVSQDLKYALREAIELLGNEASTLIVEKRRAQQKGVFSGENALDAERLTTECLRYMYRLLFMFFIEARPELGFAPMKAKAYRTGYSLESLRDGTKLGAK